jgi:DNA polymerase-3 subunit alpha
MDERGFLIFDCETSDLYDNKCWATDKEQAWIVQIAGIITDKELEEQSRFSLLLKPPHKGATISPGAFATHKIPLTACVAAGIPQWKLYSVIKPVFHNKLRLVGHNISFDSRFLHRYPKSKNERNSLMSAYKDGICTMRSSTKYCAIPPTKKMQEHKNLKSRFKSPKLEELYFKLFNEKFEGAHDASRDVDATFKCLKELIRLEVVKL